LPPPKQSSRKEAQARININNKLLKEAGWGEEKNKPDG